MHDFCGRRHARQYEQQNGTSLKVVCHTKCISTCSFSIYIALQIPQHLQCATPGCTKQKYRNDQGGYFDYCSKYCRDNRLSSGR